MRADKIIIAISLEEETFEPLRKIKTLDLDIKAEIHLVHIVPSILYARGMQLSALTYPLPEERPRIEESIVKKLMELKSELLPEYSNVTYACLFDSNEKAAFNDYVTKQHPDLVVVATRGKHGIHNFFDSSFAQYQLKHSPAKVLVLR